MTRHEQRYKIMTILYQAFLYKNNNINYDINDIINEQLEENINNYKQKISNTQNGIIILNDKIIIKTTATKNTMVEYDDSYQKYGFKDYIIKSNDKNKILHTLDKYLK